MRSLLILSILFITTPLVLATATIVSLIVVYRSHTNPATTAYLSSTKTVAYAALPSTGETYESEVVSEDARVELVRQFFQKHNSPLEPYAEVVVQKADAYELDFRLIPAIAMQESNLCRRIPVNSHNCWGYGIYGDKVTRFPSYEAGIEAVTKTLATKYRQSGLDTPDEIMRRYTPSSNGSWANGVNYFLAQLQ